MESRHHRIATAQYAKAVRERNEYIKFCMDPDNVSTWYILIHNVMGDKDEFAGGEYIARVEIPSEFPRKPPHFYFMTPQGLYGLNEKVCISIGEFHADQFRPVLGIAGFCDNLVSGLIGWRTMGGGIRILDTTVAEKRAMAGESVAYNAQYNAEIRDMIETAYIQYSANHQ